MANKRPSYPSIRARQKNIIEGLGTKDLSIKEAAKIFGVKPRELENFIVTKPKVQRRTFNRSPVYAKLFAAGERSELRKTLGVRGIKHYAIRKEEVRTMVSSRRYDPIETETRVQIGHILQNLYYGRQQAQGEWALYVREHNLPTSITLIKHLYKQKIIDGSTYASAIDEWRVIYGISDNIYGLYTDELSGYDDQIEAAS